MEHFQVPEGYMDKLNLCSDLFEHYSSLCSKQRKVLDIMSLMFDSLGSQLNGSKRKRSANDKGDGLKRAKTAYNVFMQKQLQISKVEQPELQHRERFKQIASMWKTLGDAEKQTYEAQAASEKAANAASAARQQEDASAEEEAGDVASSPVRSAAALSDTAGGGSGETEKKKKKKKKKDKKRDQTSNEAEGESADNDAKKKKKKLKKKMKAAAAAAAAA
eukprot:CAMPEP_0118986914 /NCGR_PEP_ID=MMETSP1173-20130426/43099_1 /TAXON_ID=1034831 /ORGANISM="Rhizochromulina marina cf, Strain CCMP1243" /LENGTH=218 /DNA_ID=CAMNT_0006937727 /DNA_START=1 /DNA_END=654 /DNA_ORIENTATION=+